MNIKLPNASIATTVRGLSLAVVSTFLVTSLISSCSDYDNGVTENELRYDASFRDKFGEIDPTHDWGLSAMPMIVPDAGMTRATVNDRNLWEDTYHLVVPGGLEERDDAPWGWTTGDITQYERAYVYWWFSTHRNPVSMDVNWSDYFIQNVWGQPEHSGVYANGSGYTTNLKMDKLAVYEPNNPNANSGNGYYVDVNNFNSSGGAKEQVDYETTSSTLNFKYHGSADNFDRGDNDGDRIEHVIVCINGNYYLAFDYSAVTGNTLESGGKARAGSINRDGYYNDWILKITPGLHTEYDGYTKRLMCEDLGNTDDIDFNDVVFDLTFILEDWSTCKGKALITVQAAGGTLPLYIGNQEVHDLFGVDRNVMVNTDNGYGVSRPAAIFSIEGITGQQITENGKTYWYADPNQISVSVDKSGVEQGAETLVPMKPMLALSNSDDLEVLKTKIGETPSKFACPNSTRWLKERIQINEGYPYFAKWVQDQDTYDDTWYKTGLVDANLTGIIGKSTSSVEYVPNSNWPYTTEYEWKYLWDNRANKIFWNNSQTEADAALNTYTTVFDPNGSENMQTFESQQPYIYVDPNDASKDLKVISPSVMPAVLNSGTNNIYVGDKLVTDWNNPGSATTVVQRYTIKIGKSTGGYAYFDDNTSTTTAYYGISKYYDAESSFKITAVANDGYRFVKWSDGNTDNPRTLTANSECTYMPVFEEISEE